ncbi:hypothetical protein CALCODRAFT_109039 [Calocera cornea HHB12733]|uniref:Ricin B lectin domain-containing protein n=1 Tax=Calocera cornea HHB12733 TaxID=1353952 RepID=A0A165IHF7_9BASI|nr:hypothetical protein CALCODRAFT_109039 [Calocera cornea HHB12733]
MARQLEQIQDVIVQSRSLTPGTPDSSFANQMLPEGVYQIINVSTGRAIERGHTGTDDTFLVPALECRSRRQLWSVMYSPRHEKGYWIRSLFDGQVLDNLARGTLPWAGAYKLHGDTWQTWEIEPKSEAGGSTTYTIKTVCNGSVLDSNCPKLSQCTRIHCRGKRADAVSQEWNFVLLELRPPPKAESVFGLQDALFIQNKYSKGYLTQQDDLNQPEHPNITAQQDATSGSAWHFLYATKPGVTGPNKVFYIMSAYYGSALDHCNQRFLHASVGLKDNDHLWWEVIPSGECTVLFKNRASGRLLCHGAPNGTEQAQTMDEAEYQNPMCQWHVSDTPRGQEHHDTCIIYDPYLYLNDPIPALQPTSSTAGSLLQVPTANKAATSVPWQNSLTVRRRRELEEAAQKERKLLAKVAGQGYSTFVLGPDEIDAANKVEWESVKLFNVSDTTGKGYREPRC